MFKNYSSAGTVCIIQMLSYIAINAKPFPVDPVTLWFQQNGIAKSYANTADKNKMLHFNISLFLTPAFSQCPHPQCCPIAILQCLHPFLSTYLAVLPAWDIIGESTRVIVSAIHSSIPHTGFHLRLSVNGSVRYGLSISVFFFFLLVFWVDSRLTDIQRGQLSEACFPHIMPEKWQQFLSALSHTKANVKCLILWTWDGILTVILKTWAAYAHFMMYFNFIAGVTIAAHQVDHISDSQPRTWAYDEFPYYSF